jgi:hypothetical protein
MKNNLNSVLLFGLLGAFHLLHAEVDFLTPRSSPSTFELVEAHHSEYHVPFRFFCKRRLEEIKRLVSRVSLPQIHEARLLSELITQVAVRIEDMIRCGELCYGILAHLHTTYYEDVDQLLNELRTVQYRVQATMYYTQSCRSRSAIDYSESVQFQPVHDSAQEGTGSVPPSWMRCFLNPKKVSGNLQSLSRGQEAANRYDELCDIYDYVTKAHDELRRTWDCIKLY